MPRIKRTSRREPMEDIIYEAPPQDHPLEKYFSTYDDLNAYLITFSDRKEIAPRYLDVSLLNTQNFHSLTRILNDQGLMEFVQFRDNYYSDLVGMAYSTLKVDFNEQNEAEFMFKFKLFKKEYEIGCSELANIWSLPYSGCLFDGKKTPQEWGSNIKQLAYEMFNINRQPKKKASINVLTTEMRVLHYLLVYVIMPRSYGHGHIKDEDIVTMWAMVNEIKMNWTYFIVHHMLRYTKGVSSSGFGYVCLWSKIFNHFGIDVSGEARKGMARTSVINISTLHHMGRNLGEQEQEVEEQQPPPQAQAQEDQGGPSEQPSMSDLLRAIQSMEQNMNQRLQRIEDNQANLQQVQVRMRRSIRRMEAYVYSEDEWTDDNQD
ncbi:hypothetical protein PIB30_095934 [Stylosanthes scabra]|uniref:Uncharacterized protein n=1 Tax=Stylosanthes scabra TaxID=79078 RepID=A0ABU6YV61_9FABA|nr:hypothetical protein [Stylosanthes scabra]